MLRPNTEYESTKHHLLGKMYVVDVNPIAPTNIPRRVLHNYV